MSAALQPAKSTAMHITAIPFIVDYGSFLRAKLRIISLKAKKSTKIFNVF
jgi:hypothetical protein